MTQRILVTGAAGTVGQAVMAQLRADRTKPEIIALDQDTPRARRALAPYARHARLVFADITDASALASACKGVDAVLHLAAVIPPAADHFPALAERVNLGGTRALIAALEAHAPGAFLVYASSVSVYGDRLENPEIRVGDPLRPSEGDHYAETKVAAEAALRASAIDWTILRLAAVMGGHSMSPLMFHMPLDTTLEIVTAEDVARAFARAPAARKALSHRIFNLGGGPDCRISYQAFLDHMFTLVGLGKADFPDGAFARQNFHCGAYVDGDALEEILQFRRESLESYFAKVAQDWPWWKRWPLGLLRRLIKARLLAASEPRTALKSGDEAATRRFFGNRPSV